MKKYLDGAGLKNVLQRLKGKLDEKTSRPNLLDNPRWDKLAYIVNQRGVSGEISDVGYFIDRWKLLDGGTVTVADGGLVLNGTMVQIFENDPGEPVTASVLTTTGLGTAKYNAEDKTFTITAEGATLLAAKLELGDGQTLAREKGGAWVLNDPPPNYATELLKCQRYQVVFNDEITAAGRAQSSSGNTIIRAMVPLPTTLRTKPTIIENLWSVFTDRNKSYINLQANVSHITANGVFLLINCKEVVGEGAIACVIRVPSLTSSNLTIFDANL